MPRPEPNMTRADYLQMHRERRELIVAAVRAGKKTYAEIGEQFGVSGARVSQIATKAGIKRPLGGSRRGERTRAFLKSPNPLQNPPNAGGNTPRTLAEESTTEHLA